jgi:hypothetical protein
MDMSKGPETPEPSSAEDEPITSYERVRLAEIAALARDFSDEFDEFARESGKQFTSLAQRARTNRRLIFVVLLGCGLDILLTIVLAIFGVGVINNTNRIDDLTARLDQAQTVQRQKALCPLYQIFLDSKSAAGRKAAPDPKKYDHAFVVIRQGYDALECDQYITGTPAPVSPSG